MKFLCVLTALCVFETTHSVPSIFNTLRGLKADKCKTQKPKAPPPPNNSNCWQWWTPPPNGVVTFDIPQPPTGCDYKPCERAVCDCDPYCCEQAWDLSCRGYYMHKTDSQRGNYFVSGCNASQLCCEPPEAFPKPPPPQAALPPQNILYNVYVEVESKNTKTETVITNP